MSGNICRLCLSSEDGKNMLPLIENNTTRGLSAYGLSVKKFAEISIEKDDKFPKRMCRKCLYLLKCAIYFKLKCESSEKRLKQWTDNAFNKKRKQGNLKKKNNQLSVFKEYFSDKKHEVTSTSTDIPKISQKSAKNLQNLDENVNSNDSFVDDIFQVEHHDSNISMTHDDSSGLLDIMESNPEVTNSTDKSSIKTTAKKIKKCITKQNNFECQVCKKVLANPITYEQHMQYHTGCKYICDQCGKGFPAIARLQLHQVTIHGTGRYLPCQYCSYKAPRKISLIEHERLHTGERPYTCDKCGLTFRRRAIWRKHMIYHGNKTVQCQQCPRKFFTSAEMKAHANNIHERLYMYMCHKCDATYAKTETVRKHLVEKHGIPKEMQGKIVRINRGKRSNTVEP